MTARQLLATFTIADCQLAIDAHTVQEVLNNQVVVEAPGADPTVLGLMNLRGQVVTTIDLGLRMGLRSRASSDTRFHVIVRTEEGPVSLPLDGVGQVLDASDLVPDNPPETLSPILREIISGVHQLDDGLLLILDVPAVTGIGWPAVSPVEVESESSKGGQDDSRAGA